MAKKEWVLNIAFNRWQFNRPKYVGELSRTIREVAPSTLEEWKTYYLSQTSLPGIKQMLGNNMEEHLLEIGRRLYVKISEQLKAEIETITEEDCIQYVYEVVINRTYEGYETEKETVYKQLDHTLGVKLEPAPDEWDRAYNVDFIYLLGTKLLAFKSSLPPIRKHQNYTIGDSGCRLLIGVSPRSMVGKYSLFSPSKRGRQRR
jgi:hypothetical protein